MPADTELLGDWVLKGVLGQGGFGEVNHWINRSTNQEIATKHIKNAERMSADQQVKLQTRWKQEYEMTCRFQKVGCIVAGVQLGEDSNGFLNYLKSRHMWQLPVIILEYCNGGDVRRLLQRPKNANGLLEFEVREILRSLRHAVEFLHKQRGICHRDLKPDNIVIHCLSNGQKLYKLTDFGLARNTPDMTIPQSVVGTRHYYAPEVVQTGKYNYKVDYWSMGIIAYEIATGGLPFIPHQGLFTIQKNIFAKQRDCIAITEDPAEADRFIFHNELPVEHHLSKPWAAQFTEWLPLALDTKYSQRGTRGATDEVQDVMFAEIDRLRGATDEVQDVMFAEIDRLLDVRVLTLFAACSYKRLEYEVTPSMTMQQLLPLIVRDTGLTETTHIYFVLPTGHPHRQLTPQTRPIDLYVDSWCDTSVESGNPRVMVYIFNTLTDCQYTAPDPCMPPMLQSCLNSASTAVNSKDWVMKRMILDMHYMLSREQEHRETLLLGYNEYAMTLEHEILAYHQSIKKLGENKDKCCGAMEQFHHLLRAAQEQQKFHLQNNGEWEAKLLKLDNEHKETVDSIDKLINHYESSLRTVRDVSIKQSNDLCNRTKAVDIYKLKKFRENYLRPGESLTGSELRGIAYDYAIARHNFLNDDQIKYLRDSLNQVHLRFAKIPFVSQSAHQSLDNIRKQLLQLQLQMLPSATPLPQPSMFQLNDALSRLSFDAGKSGPVDSLNAFDSLSTENIIVQALRTREILESEMDIDRLEQP